MSLKSSTQLNLYGLKKELNQFVELFKKSKLPNKILLSGEKGIGKCTLAYHLINFILSNNENFSYNLDSLTINPENTSYKLIQNNSNTNFHLIDIDIEKKIIDISQIRKLINTFNKSSFNSKPRFILIDNIEYLNINSTNALLKILEEPNENTYFILINNNKKIYSTILSRCLDFKISMSHKNISKINRNLFNSSINDLINADLINYYLTPGKIYYLIEFSKNKDIDLKNTNLNDFLSMIIKESYYKGDNAIKNIIYEYLEFFLIKNISIKYTDLFKYFLKRINDVRKYNLDEESLFIEVNKKLLNG